MEHSEPQEGQHSPGGRRSRALPPLASFRRGFPSSQTPSPHADVATVHGRGGIALCYKSEGMLQPGEEKEAQAGDRFVIHSLS